MDVPADGQKYQFDVYLYQSGELVKSYVGDSQFHIDKGVPIGGLIAGVVVAVITVTVLAVVGVIIYRRKTRPSKETPSSDDTAVVNVPLQPTLSSLKEIKEFEGGELQSQLLLQDGMFYQLWTAKLVSRNLQCDIVIKKLKESGNEIYSRYLDGQMITLSKLNNVNVIKLLGCQRRDDEPQYMSLSEESLSSSMDVILESAALGDLQTYLTNQASGLYERMVPIHTMMAMARGMASGALILSKQQPEVLHYCLCSHHILLDDKMVCKLTGFSTAEAVRDREKWEAYNELGRPVRWMAPDTLKQLEHTTKSDIWAFGICLWELFSLGNTPYADYSEDTAAEEIKNGTKLARPNNCDPNMYELMLECWKHKPQKRPSHDDIL